MQLSCRRPFPCLASCCQPATLKVNTLESAVICEIIRKTFVSLKILRSVEFGVSLHASLMPSERVTAKSKNQIAIVQVPAPQPQWPPLRPLVPTSDLCLEPLLEDQIIVIRNLFTSTLCKTYAAFLSTLPLITTPAQPKDGDAVRVNDRIEFHDPGFAETLWKATGLESLVSKRLVEEGNGAFHPPDDFWGGEVVGLNPRIRIYRYKEGQFFAQHCRWT